MNTIEELYKTVNRIRNINKDQFTRSRELGENAGFHELVPYLELVIKSSSYIYETKKDITPSDTVKSVLDETKEFLTTVENISRFDAQDPSSRLRLINQFKTASRSASRKFCDFYPTWVVLLEDHQAAKNTYTELFSHAEEIANLHNEATKALDEARKAAGFNAASTQSKHFLMLAKSCRTRACYSMGVLLISLLGLPIVGFLFFWISPADIKSSNDLLPMIPKLLVGATCIGVCITGIRIAGRNYFAYSHGATLNEHRSACLRTYNAIAMSTSDEKTKEILLNHAAAAIFNVPNSGFERAEPIEANHLSVLNPVTVLGKSDPK